jgi:hypothetical protein
MKRIYLLALLFIASATAFAQGPDLQLTNQVRTWQGVNVQLISANSSDNKAQDSFYYSTKNLTGPDLQTGDTLHFRAYRISKNYYFVLDKPLKKDSSRVVYATEHVVPGSSQTKSETKTIQWCDSVWVTRPSVGVIVDPNTANNKSCVNVTATYWITSVNDVNLSANTMTVYPNPASSRINVKFDFGANATGNLAVRDILGKVVYQQDLGKNLAGEKEFTIDASNFSSGIYFVELTANEAKKVAKVTVQ